MWSVGSADFALNKHLPLESDEDLDGPSFSSDSGRTDVGNRLQEVDREAGFADRIHKGEIPLRDEMDTAGHYLRDIGRTGLFLGEEEGGGPSEESGGSPALDNGGEEAVGVDELDHPPVLLLPKGLL